MTLDRAWLGLLKVVTAGALVVSGLSFLEVHAAGEAVERIGKKNLPIKGVKPGPPMDKILPGRFIIDPPTLENLGFRWYIQGDTNRNASVAVFYRKKGDADWKPALPMLRVHYEIANQDYGPCRVGNLFAGSVMFLKSATEYEAKFVMKDPDGGAPGAPRIVSATTRGEPKVFDRGRKLHAYPKDTRPTRQKGVFNGIMAAYEEAGPGDIILLHAGFYRGPYTLTKSGEPDKPIVFRAAGDGRVVIAGPNHETDLFSMDGANHHVFEDLMLWRANAAIRGGGKGSPGIVGLVVLRCRILDVVSGIWAYSENSRDWYIADNVITGINPTWHPRTTPGRGYMSPAHTGVNCYGRGIVVCYNRVSKFSDSLAIANYGPPVADVEKHCVAVDFYNNDLSWGQDDGIETDYGCHNVRVYCNRITNSHTALSAQPFYGGPCYFIRNAMYGISRITMKWHNYPAGLEIYHNTCTCAGQGFQSGPPKWHTAILRNNLILGGRGYAVETGSSSPYTTLDYNGYRQNDEGRFFKWTDHTGKTGRYLSLEELSEATGHEQHGIKVDYDSFVRAAPTVDGTTYALTDFDLRLKPGSVAVDAGCVLPNVNDGHMGKAPDLGAYEVGQPLPHYGPREP